MFWNVIGYHGRMTYDEEMAVRVPVTVGALEEVIYHFQMYVRDGGSLINRAHHLVELQNAVGDLSSYHPGYNVDNGTMPWEREGM